MVICYYNYEGKERMEEMISLKYVNDRQTAQEKVSPVIEQLKAKYKVTNVKIFIWKSDVAIFKVTGWHGFTMLMEVNLKSLEVYSKPAGIDNWVHVGNLAN